MWTLWNFANTVVIDYYVTVFDESIFDYNNKYETGTCSDEMALPPPPGTSFIDLPSELLSSSTQMYDDLPNESTNHISTSDNGTADVIVNDDVTSIDDYMWIYFSPIIFILGLCGNLLTLAVMRRKRMRGTTTSVYLPVMAVFDTLAMSFGILPEWFKACGFVVLRELHPVVCQIGKFGFYTTSDTAIWVLVLFTVDRFVAVCFPLQKTRICVPRRSKIACAVAFACSVVKNLHVFWTRGAEYNSSGHLVTNCGHTDPASAIFEALYRPWMALALISIIPFVILLICNCVMIWTLTRSRFVQMRKTETPANDKAKTFKQTTMMCLSVSFVFLLCVIPSIVVLIGKPHWTKYPNYAYEVAKAVSNQLAYFNHSINFFLYCLTGQKFRSELLSMFRHVRQSILLHPTETTFLRTSETAAAVVNTRSTVPVAMRNVHCHVLLPSGVKSHSACVV